MQHILILFCVLLFTITTFSNAQTIKVRGPQSKFDSTHDYYVGLLELAYRKINKPLTIKLSPYMVQQRALNELKAGRLIDIYWAGTDSERESTLGFVPIPLVKGLLGYRVFTAHQSATTELNKISTLDQLKTHRLCQGAHWPDTDIMIAAGLNVMPNAIYENMFKQAYSGRCFAFPRGINEAHSEVLSRTKSMPELIVYDKVILHYPFPMYFFIKKSNETLIADVTNGLNKAIEDGSFDDYMKNHQSTKHLFPLSKWKSSTVIRIDNPFLDPNRDINNSKYWVNLGH
ncbi:hypothetical protein CWB96_09630 [Pseudoalteromonas citrea]|uniref:Solute-binding protein family 3/N-terminal domain-containing protein n=1 Tax=Pseudoalteromonas citrea TaxID=43655 RepID=A0A5S3XPY8_9GAMM|nr:hypothetical protein [Pseudoalteromonas citrea]TMP38842.1 hypothetical protein CWB97_21355 [Pseudoalteromonas citrea]TMP59370.1 hypothetical protein CWB96_09630 [Pseudoalteromonas citrea]